MKILFVCTQGLSSAIAVRALKNEVDKIGEDMEILSVGTKEFEDVIQHNWDIVMVAPQERHKFERLNKIAEHNGVKCVLIKRKAYNPMGGKELLKQINEVRVLREI